MRFILPILMLLAFSGCVGIGTVYSEKQSSIAASILENGGTIYGSKTPPNKEKVIAFHGEPYKKAIDGNHEAWYYKKELAWGGIVPVVIIPIPLLLPYGYKETVIQFENDQQISIESDQTKSPIAMCSLVPMMWLVNGATNSWCHVFKSW